MVGHNRRRTDHWAARLSELVKVIIALTGFVGAATALIQNWHQDNRLDNHKEAIQQNSEAVKAVGQVQSDVTGFPNVADAIIPEAPLEGSKK